MPAPMLARAADFQAAWYLGLLLLLVLLLSLVAGALVLRGVRGMWRAGERGPAAMVGGATIVSLVVFVGMYVTAFVGLLAIGAGGGA